ncbi:MAG: PEP-CTERM sorting domain-containing protein [Pirellulales bacterium]
MVRRTFDFRLLSAGLLTATAVMLTAAATTQAASVTKQVYVTFDGSLSGTTYTLGPGEIDNSFTFGANGSATISGGVADIPGDVDLTSGFYFSGADLVTEQALGSLKTTNWITEAIYKPDVPAAGQPSPAGNTNNYGNHILDLQGDTFYRYDGFGRTPKVTDFGYWDGGAEDIEPAGEPSVGQFHHIALVWNAGTNSVEAYLDGVSQGVATTGSAFDVSSPNIGYGFFSRFLNRAVDGKFDAVAFSTYTGEFNASSDFQLPTVPEPSAFALVAIALGGLAWVRKK